MDKRHLPQRELEALLLGAILANKSVREMAKSEWFTTQGFREMAAEVLGPFGPAHACEKFLACHNIERSSHGILASLAEAAQSRARDRREVMVRTVAALVGCSDAEASKIMEAADGQKQTAGSAAPSEAPAEQVRPGCAEVAVRGDDANREGLCPDPGHHEGQW